MEHALSLVLLAVAAFVLPLLADRIRIPAIVVEILFGVVAGPSVLGLIASDEVVVFLAELGFLLLMFLSGFEVDFSRLGRTGGGQILTGLAVFALTLPLAYVATILLGHGPFVMLLLATTSVGLVVPTLRGTRRIGTSLGQLVLISALLADFLTLVGVTVFAMLREHGWGWKLMNFPLLFVSILTVLVAVRRFAWWYPDRLERLFARDDPEEMGIRASLAMMFVLVGVSYMLGVEPFLGAFLGGVVFALVFRHRGHLEQKLSGFSYGFLIPIFFIHVGTRFDLAVISKPATLLGALGLVAASVAVKVLASTVLVFRRTPVREIVAAGVLLSARLSLVIAVATLGVRLGILDRALESQVILLAVVTSTLAPTVFRRLVPPLDEASSLRGRAPAAAAYSAARPQ